MTKLPHILVVEDDREISALVARYLRSNDCRVTVAGNGRDVDRVMNGSRIDLIVLDLMLPGEDGLSLCKRLRTHSQVPIIMLTAKGDEVDRIEAVQSARTAGARPRRAAALNHHRAQSGDEQRARAQLPRLANPPRPARA
jgi:CheY-like chemotaxis protein